MGSQIRMGHEFIDIEHRPQPGFTEHVLYVPSKRSALYDAPIDEPESLLKTRPPHVSNHATATVIDWPTISVQRRINTQEAGAPWRQFTERFEHATRRFGVATELGKLTCEYITSEEFGVMLSQRYPEVARDPHMGRSKRIARDVVGRLNEHMRDLRGMHARTQDLVFVDDLPTLWQPASIEVGPRLDGRGPRRTVLPLIDEEGIFLKERQDTIGVLKDFGMNVSMISTDWQPEVTVLENDGTVTPRKASFKAPNYPLFMPFEAPKTYITT